MAKTTKREYYAMVSEIVSNSEVANKDEILNFIQREVELLNKKSASNAQTKTQKENVEVKAQIREALATFDNAVTVTEIQTLVAGSNQKISALLRQMVEAGEVVKTSDKKKSLFSLAR